MSKQIEEVIEEEIIPPKIEEPTGEPLTKQIETAIKKKEEEIEEFEEIKQIKNKEEDIIPPSPARHIGTVAAFVLIFGGGFFILRNLKSKQNTDKIDMAGQENGK